MELQEKLSVAVLTLQRQPARCHQRLFPSRDECRRSSAGIPEDVLEAAREAAKADGQSGWKFTLHAPSYVPVMQYADNRALRETMYRAYVTRASEFGEPEVGQHAAHRRRSSKLRRELAKLLDFGSFAAYSLEPKMAQSPQAGARFPAGARRAARSRSRSGTSASCANSRARELGLAELAVVGHGLCVREAARGALRLLRAGSEAVFSRDAGAAGHVQARGDALRVLDHAGAGAALARGCALLRDHGPLRRTRRPVLPRPVCTPQQARRRVDGRRHHPPPTRGRRSRRRLPTSTATSRRRSAAVLRFSPTTR